MAAVEEAGTLTEQTSIDQVESVRVGEDVAVVEYLAATTVGASTALDMALVLASTSLPSPSFAG
jgi:hypothetical protein